MKSFKRIVDILDGRLQYDDEGRARVYVPGVSHPSGTVGVTFRQSK